MRLEIITFNQRVAKLENEAEMATTRAADATEALERLQSSSELASSTQEEKLNFNQSLDDLWGEFAG